MYLYNIGASLKFIEWSTDLLNNTGEHTLVLDSHNFNAKLSFQAVELEDYACHLGIIRIEHRIRQIINSVMN